MQTIEMWVKKNPYHTINVESNGNAYKHKKKDVLYAHYSMIDEYDVKIFPNLLFTNPTHLKIKKGESLYIPKKWWHWIKTTQKTFAVNYWFKNSIETQENPFIFKHTIDYDVNLLNDETVCVWNSTKIYSENCDSGRVEQKNFKDFYNCGENNKCVITLKDYPAGENNLHLKNKLRDYIKFPIDERLNTIHTYNYNLWFCSNEHDTGLHYDDEDGILTVVEGEKDVILFPPSDTQYLYPYESNYEWKNTSAKNFKYNTFTDNGKIDGVSSGKLLHVTCNEDVRVLRNITKSFYEYQDTNLVWGFKKSGDDYRWEVYHYAFDDEYAIRSWDIYKNAYDILDIIHYYYRLDDNDDKLPFWGYGKYKKNGVIYDESKIFVIDEYESFEKNYDEYMAKLGYESIATRFKDTILKKYNCL
jgi:hypothetical protein